MFNRPTTWFSTTWLLYAYYYRLSSIIYFTGEFHPTEFAHLLDGHKFILCICTLVDLILKPAGKQK
jgi:hypothetical protein